MADSAFEYLRSRFIELLAGPPLVRQVVFEWPEDLDRPSEEIRKHPSLSGGLSYSTSKWISPDAQISHHWAFEIWTMIDVNALAVCNERRGIVDDLIKKTCAELERCESSYWYGRRNVFDTERLTAEIISRLKPRRMLHPLDRRLHKMYCRWGNPMAVFEDRPHCRSWIIDDFAADAAETLRLILNEYDQSPGRSGSTPDKTYLPAEIFKAIGCSDTKLKSLAKAAEITGRPAKKGDRYSYGDYLRILAHAIDGGCTDDLHIKNAKRLLAEAKAETFPNTRNKAEVL
jgi:hypothetical protein